MSLETRFISSLQKLKQEKSTGSLINPKDKTSFGYGEASGIQQGLELAEQLFLRLLRDEEYDGT